MARLSQVVATIQDYADSLRLISDTDGEVNSFVIGRNIKRLNAGTFQSANPFVRDAQIETLDFEEKMSSIASGDNSRGWSLMKNYLESELDQLTVFKTGSVEREFYAVGLLGGYIVGIKSFAVET